MPRPLCTIYTTCNILDGLSTQPTTGYVPPHLQTIVLQLHEGGGSSYNQTDTDRPRHEDIECTTNMNTLVNGQFHSQKINMHLAWHTAWLVD